MNGNDGWNTLETRACALWVFQGRREGVNIDPWEDSDFNIYKVTDRFGFLQ